MTHSTRKKKWWIPAFICLFTWLGITNVFADISENYLHYPDNGYMKVEYDQGQGKIIMKYPLASMGKEGLVSNGAFMTELVIKVKADGVSETSCYSISCITTDNRWDGIRSFKVTNHKYNNANWGRWSTLHYNPRISGTSIISEDWTNYYSATDTKNKEYQKHPKSNEKNGYWGTETHCYIPSAWVGKKLTIIYSYKYRYSWVSTNSPKIVSGNREFSVDLTNPVNQFSSATASVQSGDNRIKIDWNIAMLNTDKTKDGSGKIAVYKQQDGSSTWTLVKEDSDYGNTSKEGTVYVNYTELTQSDLDKGIKLKVVRKRQPQNTSMNTPVFTAESSPSSVFHFPTFNKSNGLILKELAGGKIELSWKMNSKTQTSDPGNAKFVIERATKADYSDAKAISGSFAYESNKDIYTFEDAFPDREKGNVSYYYRVKNNYYDGWTENQSICFLLKNNISVNTNYATILNTAKADLSGAQDVKLSWQVSPTGVWGDYKFRIKWDIQGGVSGQADKTLNTTQGLSDSTFTYIHTNVTSCIPVNYTIEIVDGATVINSRSLESIVVPDNTNSSLDTLKVSKGKYSNYVSVEWEVSGAFSNYIVYRQELSEENNENTRVQLGVVNHNSGVKSYRFEDEKALPGFYYTYTVVGQVVCNNEVLNSASGTRSSVGFVEQFGVASGRVAFDDGTTAVEGATILVEGTDKMKNKALEFDGSQNTFIEAGAKKDLFSESAFAFQAYVKTRDLTGEQYLFYNAGKYIISLTANRKVKIRIGMESYEFATAIPETYSHITLNYYINESNNKIVDFYLDGKIAETKDFGAGSLGFDNTDQPILIGKGSVNGYFDGYMDELRIWNSALDSLEIAQNYNRYLSGKEDGLKLYYRFDEIFGAEVYDVSGQGGKFNENHGQIKGKVARTTTEIPTPTQLSIKGITDRNGQYLINTIPYSAGGSIYTLTPQLGVHVFSPSEKNLFFNRSTNTANEVNFTDISSFKVTGKIYYEGGNYPVEGCLFYVDDAVLVDRSGTPVSSQANGEFEIQVPIGQHKLQVKKTGHTFLNNGLALQNGENIVFNDDISMLNFQDNTRVKLVGRVVGGKVEHEKTLGFAESKNNIGFDQIKFVARKDQYTLWTGAAPATEKFYHNEGEWKKTIDNAIQQDSTEISVFENAITITPSAETGEFVAWIYPESYTIENIDVQAAAGTLNVYDRREVLDLTAAPVDNSDFLQMSIRTWQDSVFVKGKGSQRDHYEYSEYSDTVRYHKKWTHYYQELPTFSVRQIEADSTTLSGFWGDSIFYKENPITGKRDTIRLIEPDNQTNMYVFDYPVFQQGHTYSFKLKAYEEYFNAAKNTKDTVPVQGGIAKISNALEFEPSDDIELDSIGESIYTFDTGYPDLTNGVKEFSAVIDIDGIVYDWEYSGSAQIAYLLGSRSTGTDFMTTGPDNIIAVLHDPPGSLSYAYLEKGTTVKSSTMLAIANSISGEAGVSADAGPKITTYAGTPVAGTINSVETIVEMEVGVRSEVSTKLGVGAEVSSTFTERFETSDDPMYVGHMGDVFIGRSTNIQYGLTNSVTILSEEEQQEASNESFNSKGKYAIGKSQGLSIGQKFGTLFAYTEVQLEEVTIPSWENALEKLFIFGDPADVNTASITEPVYVSKLPADHEHFGKKNTDKEAFGTEAASSTEYYKGPSYVTVFPNGYLHSEKMNTYEDQVINYNNQIKQWKKVLADNEEQKVNMEYAGNYSFGPGAKVEYSSSKSKSYTLDTEFSFVIGTEMATKIGSEVAGIEMAVTGKSNISVSTSTSASVGTEESTTTGFVLQEDGDDDQISVDYGWTDGGTIAFRSRGGRTSCPYEGEVRTKYYEPGLHILSEGSMQIEVPKISVSGGAYRAQVPDNRPATFTLELKNESETKEDVWFTLLVDEKTNPDGATLKIDGIGIGNGRHFLVEAGKILQKTLTIEKGSADTYENIKLLLVSQCQYDPTNPLDDIFDEIEVSVQFLPTCSDVAFREPVNNWTVNTQEGDSMQIVLDSYDINTTNFDRIELQYKEASATQWNTIMKFYADQSRYNNATGNKKLLTSTDNDITYVWNMKEMLDGRYDIRARSICATIGGYEIATYETPVLSGVKDMVRPTLFGKPQPTDGVLTGMNDIMIQFNEDINEGMVTKNNFMITGIKNGTKDNHFTSVHFDGQSSNMTTEQEINLSGKSFTVEFWLKRDALGESTVFTHGQSGEQFSIGFTSDNKLRVQVGNSILTSNESITNTTEWGHWAVVYDIVPSTITAYYASGSADKVLIGDAQVQYYNTTGQIRVGSTFENTGFVTGNIHGLRIWDKAQTASKIASQMNSRMSGNEIGLISCWAMNEGKGTIAQDKSFSRHGVLNASWEILPEGKSIVLKGSSQSYTSVQAGSNIVFRTENDFTIEMWFKGATADGTLFSCGRGDGNDRATADKLSIYFDGNTLKLANNGKAHEVSSKNFLDDQWHHFAFTVNRTGTANMYVDGNLENYIDAKEIGSLAGNTMYFGIRKWLDSNYDEKTDKPFKGNIDEIRFWQMALSEDIIDENMNVRLLGNEMGLIAYYPFDTYVVNTNDQKELAYSLDSQVEGSNMPMTANQADASAEIPPVKDAGPVSNYDFNFVTNKDKIVLNLLDGNDAIENTLITISADKILDLNGNQMVSPISWTAYIDRNFLKWAESSVSQSKKNNETLTFNTRIVNSGGSIEPFTIENLPSWLEAKPMSGSVEPLGTKTITFTVHNGLNPGMYEELIYLRGTYTSPMALQLNVGGEKPDWTVDPHKYESSMSFIGQLKVNGIISKDENDLLGAFIDNECVGIASPSYNKVYDIWQVMLNVYSSTAGKAVEFRIWDASTGQVYANVSPNNVTFKSNELQGSLMSPVMFETTSSVLQRIYLNQGWNWISFNTQSAKLANVNNLMLGISNGEELKAQQAGAFSRYSADSDTWLNAALGGSGISNTQMYLLKMKGEGEISIDGTPLDPIQTQLTLKQGWNWISYIPQINMTVNEAFNGFTPAQGDIVKSITNFAVYMPGNGWIGSLEYLRPNAGYMYKSANEVTFNYPSHSSLSSASKVNRVNEAASIANASAFEHNLSLIAEVDLGTTLPENARLLAIINGEIRGTAQAMNVNGKQLFFVTIHGNADGGTVKFSLQTDNGELNLRENISFAHDAVIGSLENPKLLTQGGALTVYPNPFVNELNVLLNIEKAGSVKLSLHNLTGNTMYISDRELPEGEQLITIDAKALNAIPQGVYILKISAGENQYVYEVIKQ